MERVTADHRVDPDAPAGGGRPWGLGGRSCITTLLDDTPRYGATTLHRVPRCPVPSYLPRYWPGKYVRESLRPRELSSAPGGICQRRQRLCYTSCVMPNHTHLEDHNMSQGKLSKGMRQVTLKAASSFSYIASLSGSSATISRRNLGKLVVRTPHTTSSSISAYP
jgi:hypothetical protein